MSSFTNLVRDEKVITFDINDIDVSLVNSLRRLVFTHIQSIGFYFKLKDHFVENDMTFIKNDSPLHNEFLAHRLSLIPLHFSEEEIQNWTDGDYKFVLKKELTSSDQSTDVTTEHFEIYDKNGKQLPRSFVQRILPFNKITKEYILLTKMRPENNTKKMVHVELIAKKGVAIDCACWGTVSTCTYFNTIDEKDASKALKKLVTNEPTDKAVTANFNTLQKYRHFKKNEFDEPNAFTMTIESECALKSEVLFVQAIKIFINMLEEVTTEFENTLSDTLKIEQIGEISNFYLITVNGHTHTIGNPIQAILLNKYVRDTKILEYIGYSVPHPLENTFILKIKFTNDTSIKEVGEFMIRSIREIVDELNKTMSTFEEFISL